MRFRRAAGRRKMFWVETNDNLRDQIDIYSPSAKVSNVTTFWPLLADEGNAADKADLPFDEKSANLLGISNWGTALGEVYQRGWKPVRLVGKLRFAVQQRLAASGATAYAGAQNVMVRAGIFIGEVDENGALTNGEDFPLHTNADWKDRRWLWVREWTLSNIYGGLTAGPGGLYYPVGGGVQAADFPRLVWGPFSTEFYQSHLDNSVFDIRRTGALAKNQRLFYGYASWDPAQGPVDSTGMSTSWNLLYNKTVRALMAPGFRRAR